MRYARTSVMVPAQQRMARFKKPDAASRVVNPPFFVVLSAVCPLLAAIVADPTVLAAVRVAARARVNVRARAVLVEDLPVIRAGH